MTGRLQQLLKISVELPPVHANRPLSPCFWPKTTRSTPFSRAPCWKGLAARVTHATNGNEVLARVKAGLKPDLIIMDVEMPALDGLKTTRHLRHDESQNGSPRVPILALTANARAEDIRECHEAGMDGHLSKPFDKQDLDEAIASSFGGGARREV